MQIKIEIDVKPEELRRFLGLPDVAGLQDDVVRFVREKVGAASDSIDPSAVIQGSMDLIKRTSAWRIMREAMNGRDPESGAADAADAPTNPSRPASKKRAAARAAKTIIKTAAAAKKTRKARRANAGSLPD